MDIQNNVDGLKTLLGVSSTSSERMLPVRKEPTPGADALTSDQATLSNTGSEVSQTISGSDVRKEKVAAVQAAIATGTYQIPASAVAGKVVDAMLGAGHVSEN